MYKWKLKCTNKSPKYIQIYKINKYKIYIKQKLKIDPKISITLLPTSSFCVFSFSKIKTNREDTKIASAKLLSNKRKKEEFALYSHFRSSSVMSRALTCPSISWWSVCQFQPGNSFSRSLCRAKQSSHRSHQATDRSLEAVKLLAGFRFRFPVCNQPCLTMSRDAGEIDIRASVSKRCDTVRGRHSTELGGARPEISWFAPPPARCSFFCKLVGDTGRSVGGGGRAW